jgi:two-component system, cell cycle response regulator DivK
MAKVLVIEDDANNQEIVARFLRREGHAVLQATNGLEGVAMAQAETPDLILMDLNLPELDGWEATRRIKSSPDTAKIPIIALTAHSQLDDVKKAMGAGCDHFETKPVVYPRLMRKIEAILKA